MLLGLQSAKSCGCAASKPVDFESHALGERNKEVGERRVVLGVVCDVGTVPLAAACQDNGQVSPVVTAGVAQVGAVEH